jgi:hypothetical protein
VPFFGDQFFWGQTVAAAGAGPEPIPIARLDDSTLTAAFDACRRPQMRERAQALGARLRETDGVELAVRSIHRRLPAAAMRCPTDPDHLATAYCDTCGARLCQACEPAHVGHGKRPYYYVDWNARPPHRLVDELGELMGDAAKALQAGLHELMPRMLRAG